jgi:hypothetical protein
MVIFSLNPASVKNVKMFVHKEAPMVLVPEELPVLTLSQLQEDKCSISSICHPILST